MNYTLWVAGIIAMVIILCHGDNETADMCTGTGLLVGNADDTMKAGTVLMESTTESVVKNGECNHLNVSAKKLILSEDIYNICDETLECSIKCQEKDNNRPIRIQIHRTLEYNISFTDQTYYGSVIEMSQNNTPVTLNKSLSLSVDSCSGYARQMRYKLLEDSQDSLPFVWHLQLNGNSLQVKGLVDYETHTSFTFLIQGVLEMNKDLPSSATATIHIVVEDIDDNKPAFSIPTTENYVLELEENKEYKKPLNTTPPIEAFDPDKGLNEKILYSIISNDSGPFDIGADDGKITVFKELDYETKSLYTVIVKAAQKDQPETRTAIATLQIRVIDVDDHLPEFIENTFNCSVIEHSVEKSLVCTVTAVDKDTKPENRNFTYNLYGGEDVISIDENNGEIRVTNSTELDRDSSLGNQITVVVGTTLPNGTHGDNATVFIKLIDINDNNPEFKNTTYTFGLDDAEIGNVVGKVLATDKDADKNGEVSYEILTNPLASGCHAPFSPGSNPFGINTTTGEISVINGDTVCENYDFLVQACDNGLNRRCTHVNIKVKNTVAGVLKNLTQYLEITEGIPVGSYFGLILCGGEKRSYEYNKNQQFVINETSGMIKSNDVLDREVNDKYYFLVKIKTGNTALCRVNVTVSVLDINDNSPIFTRQFYHFVIPSNPVEDTVIGSLEANDEDIGANGNVSFSLKDSPYVKIDPVAGNISIKNAVNIRRIDITRVYVVATDNGISALQSIVPVYISGDSDRNTIPISTPMEKAAVEDEGAKLAGELSQILGTEISIQMVTSIPEQESTNYRSKVHISPRRTRRSTDNSLDESFLSAVVSRYEDVKNVFYQPNAQLRSDADDKATLEAPEIGLIVMACVVLIGTIAAIIIIQRQFNSQKRYRQLFETMTKNSSMYESQELKMDIEDEVADANSGSVKENDIANTSAPPSPNLAVSALNPGFVGTEDENNVNLNDSAGPNENTDVNDTMTDGHEQEEKDTVGEHNQSVESNPVIYANVHKTDDGEDIVFVADIEPECVENSDNQLNQTDNDLIHFDNESNGVHEQESTNEGGDDETEQTGEIEEEPNPDYEIKQVRFHYEVLDASENKIEPLKVKGEDVETKEIDTDEAVVPDGDDNDDGDEDEIDANDEKEAEQVDSNAGNISQTSGYNSDNPSTEENDFETNMANEKNKDWSEEEIDAPVKEQFYFDSIESTHF